MSKAQLLATPTKNPSGRAHGGRQVNAPHRAREYGGIHGQAIDQGSQPDAAAHGMGQQMVGAWKVQFLSRGQDGLDIKLVIRKLMHMAWHRVFQKAICQPLTPPIYGKRCVARRSQIGCSFSIFFNVLRSAREKQNGAFCLF